MIGLLVAPFAAPRPAAAQPGPWVVLGAGMSGAINWSVKVKDLAGPSGAGAQISDRPCILVGAFSRVDQFSFRRSSSRQCVGGADPLTADSPPLIATAAQPSDHRSARVTAIGMIFGAAVRRVQIALDGGQLVTIHLRRMTRNGADSAGLDPLRYAAFTVRGAWCLEHLVSLDSTGTALWDSGSGAYPCVAGPSQH